MKLDSFQKDILKQLGELPNSHCRFAAENSIVKLKRAYEIFKLDKSLSYFLIITAFEEAATSIIIALKTKNYSGSKQLNHRSHSHKIATYELISKSMLYLFELLDHSSPSLFVDKENGRILIELNDKENNSKLYPQPPLNIFQGAKNTPNDLYHDILKKFGGETFEDAIGTIKDTILKRNYTLYASQNGVAKFPLAQKYLVESRDSIFSVLSVLLIIMQNQKQIYVQNFLNLLLKVLEKTPNYQSYLELVEETGIKEKKFIRIITTPTN